MVFLCLPGFLRLSKARGLPMSCCLRISRSCVANLRHQPRSSLLLGCGLPYRNPGCGHLAVRVLDESGPWAAGQRLMQAADPESWALIVAASPLTDANRETVQKCREQAEKAEKPVRCTIEVKAGK